MRSVRTAYLLDLDGTLTTVELLPLIAREVGLEQRVADLTRRTMAGELAFYDSLRRRVEMLADVPLATVHEIVSSVPVHEQLLGWARQRADQCWIVTSNLDVWISPLLARLGLPAYSSTAHVENGRVCLDTVLVKPDVLADFATWRTVMVGDGANDAGIMAQADIGVASALMHPPAPVVIEAADYLALEEETLCHLLSRL